MRSRRLLWPRRLVIPTPKPAVIEVPLLDAPTLASLSRDDPLLRAERALAKQPAVGAFQDMIDRKAEELLEEEPAFKITLGVLPDLTSVEGVLTSLNVTSLPDLTYAIGNLTGVEFKNEVAASADAALHEP